MKTDSDEYKVGTFGLIMKGLEIVMAIVYIAMGILVIWRSTGLFNIPHQYILPLGGALIAYGLFRAYRVYSRHFRK